MIFMRERFRGYQHKLSQWWYAIGSDGRFTPKGERERLAYVAGLRDAMREAETVSGVGEGRFWDYDSESQLRQFRIAQMKRIHARANLFSE